MIRGLPKANRTDPLFPDPTLFRSPADRIDVDLAFGADDTRFWHVDQRGQGAQQVRRRDPARKQLLVGIVVIERRPRQIDQPVRSEEHTSEPQSLMRTAYAVFCLKKTISPNQP